MEVCHMTGLGMRSDGHAGAEVHSPGQAKRRPGYNVPCSLRPVREKVLKTERVMFTFALAGRGVIGCGGLPRVSLRLPWAMEVIGLSALLAIFVTLQSCLRLNYLFVVKAG